jgi:ribosomal protein S18 acetylase RimI-like enzyme
MDVRDAEAMELDALASVWHEGWHEAHAPIVPPELTRVRTLESFRRRLQEALSSVRVIGALGAPIGFCMLKGDELYQLYVSSRSRGSGVASALIADGERRLAESGVQTAWLACAIGNERAARFYEKREWRRVGTMVNRLDESSGGFLLEVWCYEKPLRPSSRNLAAP